MTWLILFDQQIVTKTVGLYLDDYDADGEAVTTTEAIPLTESTADIIDVNTSALVIETATSKIESSSDDIIDLNVGGQQLKTYRSTLTVVPSSKLALMFSKDNKNKIAIKTKENQAYFFDYNPVQFEYLLDQLRAIKRMPQTPAYELNFKAPSVDVLFDFSNMLLDLGLIGKFD